MEWTTVETNWAAYVPRLMTRWPDLSEAELLATDGEMEAVATHIAAVKDASVADARAALASWMGGGEPADAVMDPTRDNAQIMESAKEMAAGEDAYADDVKFGAEDAPKTPVGRS